MNRVAACVFSGLLLTGMCEFPVHAEETGLRTGRFTSYTQYESAGRLNAANESFATEVTEELPDNFDLRTKGLVTSVKNQGSYGICWSFSAMNSLENHLIARKPDIDLSEWHLAYYTYAEKFGFPLAANTDIDDVFQQGGNYYMLSPMLTSWTGPVSESAFPFEDYAVLDPEAEWEEIKAQAEYHVSDANAFTYHINDENFLDQLEAVKQAVWQGNALSVSYYNKNACYDSGTYAYYNSENERTGGNYHAVSIVGWDDHFSSENFKQTPEADGAWLIKNSWGENWGDNGYFWISYYDPTMLEFYYLDTEPFEQHDAVYQYDDYGYWTAFSVTSADESAYIANVFTAQEDTWLTSVMLCNVMPNEQYAIQVYTGDVESGHPATGTASVCTYGMLAEAGYHTIDLTEPVEVHAGETFSIVVQLSGDAGQHIACEAYTRSTVTREDGSVASEANMLTEEMIFADFHEGESFYSLDGKRWHDVYEEGSIQDSYTTDDGTTFETYTVMGNICLRGLTKNAGSVIFSEDSEALPAGTEICLSSADGGEIYYSIDGGEYMLYTEPIIMPDRNMEISAYVFSAEGKNPIYEKSYAVQQAQLSSLLAIRNQDEKDYLVFEEYDTQKYRAYCTQLEAGETFAFMPITTGQVLYNGEQIPSGSVIQAEPDETGRILLHISQEGMLDTVYEIDFAACLLGDADNDGKVNAADAAEVLVYATLRAVTKEEIADEQWLVRADYNQDGTVNAADAAAILVYATKQGVS